MSTPSASLPTTQPTTVPVPVVSLKGVLPYWIFAGIVLMLLTPWMKKKMHGVH